MEINHFSWGLPEVLSRTARQFHDIPMLKKEQWKNHVRGNCLSGNHFSGGLPAVQSRTAK